jgi:hypothetical protein
MIPFIYTLLFTFVEVLISKYFNQNIWKILSQQSIGYFVPLDPFIVHVYILLNLFLNIQNKSIVCFHYTDI